MKKLLMFSALSSIILFSTNIYADKNLPQICNQQSGNITVLMPEILIGQGSSQGSLYCPHESQTLTTGQCFTFTSCEIQNIKNLEGQIQIS